MINVLSNLKLLTNKELTLEMSILRKRIQVANNTLEKLTKEYTDELAITRVKLLDEYYKRRFDNVITFKS